MTQRRVENTRVQFWNFSPVSVNKRLDQILELRKIFMACKRFAERNFPQRDIQLCSELFVSVVYRLTVGMS